MVLASLCAALADSPSLFFDVHSALVAESSILKPMLNGDPYSSIAVLMEEGK